MSADGGAWTGGEGGGGGRRRSRWWVGRGWARRRRNGGPGRWVGAGPQSPATRPASRLERSLLHSGSAEGRRCVNGSAKGGGRLQTVQAPVRGGGGGAARSESRGRWRSQWFWDGRGWARRRRNGGPGGGWWQGRSLRRRDRLTGWKGAVIANGSAERGGSRLSVGGWVAALKLRAEGWLCVNGSAKRGEAPTVCAPGGWAEMARSRSEPEGGGGGVVAAGRWRSRWFWDGRGWARRRRNGGPGGGWWQGRSLRRRDRLTGWKG